MSSLLRQHLIDPEVCIRCNTCEEACPNDAISHDRNNYVVDPKKCTGSGDCLRPCPTGAIDSWRHVTTPYTLAEQLGWEVLPAQIAAPEPDAALPEEVAAITQVAERTVAGRARPPWSAAHPYVSLYDVNRPALATVTGILKLTGESAESDIRHIVLDFGRLAFPVLEGQSVGIVPPGTDGQGRAHHVRLYSVASPRDGERPRHNNLALTVKRVTVDREGKPTHGIASNYLCDLKRGDTVNVTGPFGTTFLMPNHPGSKLLMICTGTGAAPMRAMTERRRRRLALNEGGNSLLFFGARNPEELPYFGPLMKLPRSLIDVELAFSRVVGLPRVYVQDRLTARADDVFQLLQDSNTFVYLCGHKNMERDVLKALRNICTSRGVDFDSFVEALEREGRLHVETY